jgi:hypothetical protein
MKMKKLTTMTVIAGLALVLTTAHGFAQSNIPGSNNYPRERSGGSQFSPCDTMGFMRRVSRTDIDAIHNGQKIALIAVCEDLTVPMRNSYGDLFVTGNVDALRAPIARNTALMSALRAKDYDQHDVVNLRYGAGNSIILYVHQRDMN